MRTQVEQMPDSVGYRLKMGVIVPSTNTVVEHDFNAVRIPGVTFHAGRMYVEDPRLDSDDSFEHLLVQIRASLSIAIRDVLTAKPDYLIMGMSAETFWGGNEGNAQFEAQVLSLANGLGLSTGAAACNAALEVFDVKRIAVVSPYQPVADAMVTTFFEENGFDVVRYHGLKCPSATAIADVTEAELVTVMQNELAGEDVEAIVQVGTNLSMLRLADEAERWLRKPVIAINAATLWHSLRENGIHDQFPGFGSLFRVH